VVIDMHPHAKLYAFLWSASLALAFSFGTTQLLVSFVPAPSNQVLGLTHVVLFMLLWRQSFDFFAAHCLQRIDLQNNGFLIETLTHERPCAPTVRVFFRFEFGSKSYRSI